MQLQIEEIAALLHIYEKASGHPQLTNICNEAWKALVAINADHAPQAPAKPEPEPQPEPIPQPEPEKEPAHAA